MRQLSWTASTAYVRLLRVSRQSRSWVVGDPLHRAGPGAVCRTACGVASDQARNLVTRLPAAGPLFGRLGLDAGPADALARAARVADAQALATIDWRGAPAADVAAAGAATGAYLVLLDLADRAGLAEDLDLCLRLGLIGQEVPRDGGRIACENAAEICDRARALGATVTLEETGPAAAEELLAALTALRADAPSTGVTLCADLPRTLADCRDLARPGYRVRLRTARRPARRLMPTPDRASHHHRERYAACLGVLLAGTGYPMIATEDPLLIALATRLAVEVGRRRDSFEFQTVRGVLRREHRQLAAAGFRTRAYVAYGPTTRPAAAA